MSDILRLILPFFGLIFLGYGAGRLGRVVNEGLAGLNFFILYLALPALFFQLIATTPLSQFAGWSFVLTTTFSTYCAFAIAFSAGALINGGNVPEATIQGMLGSHANIGYMAPGLALAAFGPAAAMPIALIFTFDTAMILVTVPLMMALGGTLRTDPVAMAQSIARQVLLHPFIIATALGFIAAAIGLRLPGPVDGLLTMLRSAAAPCALFALGAGLAIRPLGRRLPSELPILVGIKLVVHPLIVYLLLSWVGGFDPIWINVAVLLAALPPAASAITLAQQHGTYVERSAQTVLIGTIISIATVTVVVILLLKDVLPNDPFR